MKYRVEILVDHKNKKTQVLIWDGTMIVENKTYDEFIGDTAKNREMFLKSFESNKGKDNED